MGKQKKREHHLAKWPEEEEGEGGGEGRTGGIFRNTEVDLKHVVLTHKHTHKIYLM